MRTSCHRGREMVLGGKVVDEDEYRVENLIEIVIVIVIRR